MGDESLDKEKKAKSTLLNRILIAVIITILVLSGLILANSFLKYDDHIKNNALFSTILFVGFLAQSYFLVGSCLENKQEKQSFYRILAAHSFFIFLVLLFPKLWSIYFYTTLSYISIFGIVYRKYLLPRTSEIGLTIFFLVASFILWPIYKFPIINSIFFITALFFLIALFYTLSKKTPSRNIKIALYSWYLFIQFIFLIALFTNFFEFGPDKIKEINLHNLFVTFVVGASLFSVLSTFFYLFLLVVSYFISKDSEKKHKHSNEISEGTNVFLTLIALVLAISLDRKTLTSDVSFNELENEIIAKFDTKATDVKLLLVSLTLISMFLLLNALFKILDTISFIAYFLVAYSFFEKASQQKTKIF